MQAIVEFLREHEGRGAGERATMDAGAASALQRQGIARIVGDYVPPAPPVDPVTPVAQGEEAQPATDAAEGVASSPRRKRAGDE
jgi:hypothetical protein